MDLIRKIPKKFTKKFGNKVVNRQYFRRRTGLQFSTLTYLNSGFGGLWDMLEIFSQKDWA